VDAIDVSSLDRELESEECEAVKKSKQLFRRLTDEGAKKHKVQVLAYLCELCVLCGFA
jgi:hypothetical protein